MRLLFFAGNGASQTRRFRHCAVSFIISFPVLFLPLDCLLTGEKNYKRLWVIAGHWLTDLVPLKILPNFLGQRTEKTL